MVFLVISFAPRSTVIQSGYSSPVSTASKELTIRLQFDDFTSMSSLAVFSISPLFTSAVVDRDIDVKYSGKAVTLDSNQVQTMTFNIDVTKSYFVKSEETNFATAFNFMAFPNVNFSSIIISIDVSSPYPVLSNCLVEVTSIGRALPILGVVWISLTTTAVGLILLLLIQKRVRPGANDQWMTIILIGGLIVVDGPWLLCQYYGLPDFSVVFDCMPQIFHAFFIYFTIIFFRERTSDVVQKFFKNTFIAVAVVALQIIVLVMQAWVTNGMPFATFAFYRNYSNAVFITLVVIFIIFHLAVIATFFVGFTHLRIERFLSLALVIFMFCVQEAVQIVTMLIRVFVGTDKIGYSLAADIFYILEANLFCFVMLYVNTPVSRSADSTHRLKYQAAEDPLET